jgi:hypothetical protein
MTRPMQIEDKVGWVRAETIEMAVAICQYSSWLLHARGTSYCTKADLYKVAVDRVTVQKLVTSYGSFGSYLMA